MRVFLSFLYLFVFLYTPQTLLGIDFNRYHSYQFINRFMVKLAKDFPDIITLRRLGYSHLGREINYIVFSNGNRDRPVIYINGVHHGHEKSSAESVLGIISYLVTHQKKGLISNLLERYNIYIQPIVNPDGYIFNSRNNALGIDINRDYLSPKRNYRKAYRTIESVLVRQLVDNANIRVAIAFHSGMEGILWPWCHSDLPTKHDRIFRSIGYKIGKSINLPYMQSSHSYQTVGEFIDYVYMKHQALAFTFEVSNEPKPSTDRLGYYVDRAIKGTMALFNEVLANHDIARKDNELITTN